eukprot:TRINITY_DN7769_c0_g5_i1.p2 TRINITY_DN7769_c0_g5~~TRINITY_DN7769_c0_g5_i1.p2  ORF type:complete len:149 (+),score=35.94 TRINITY_DN7769_c0_g5_i1:397-843(+)
MAERHQQWTELTDGQQVPKRIGPLGNWVNNQRKARKAGTLHLERVLAAEAAGLKWDASAQSGGKGRTFVDQVGWDAKFEELKRFRAANKGNLRPTPSENLQLYQWCRHQRRAYHDEHHSIASGGKSVTISPANITRLHRIGFDFSSGS